jgi:GntR family transcriptional regulator, histidine utilization repressor
MTVPLKPGTDGAPVALYQRIRNDLESRILSGEWPPGHRVPFEHELMDLYACSRMTVNKVISGLASAGLVERRRRAGTFVARPPIQSAVLQIPDLKAEVEGRGECYGYVLMDRQQRIATSSDMKRLGVSARTSILALRCLHLSQARPFAVEDRLISLRAVPDAQHQDFSVVLPNAWLVSHVPWTEAEHRISAAKPDERARTDLQVRADEACLILDRRTWRNGEPITSVRMIHPGHLYDVVARFTPTG